MQIHLNRIFISKQNYVGLIKIIKKNIQYKKKVYKEKINILKNKNIKTTTKNRITLPKQNQREEEENIKLFLQYILKINVF